MEKISSVEALVKEILSRKEAAIKTISESDSQDLNEKKSLLKTVSISPLTRNWMKACAQIFNIKVSSEIKDRQAWIVYFGIEKLLSVVVEVESLVDTTIMSLVKENTDGTRSSSVSLKKGYYEEFASQVNDIFFDETDVQIEDIEDKSIKKEKVKVEKPKPAVKAHVDFQSEQSDPVGSGTTLGNDDEWPDDF